MDAQTLDIVKSVATTVVTVVATVATLKADIRWIKRWLTEHAKADDQNFERVDNRLNTIETRLMSQK